MLPQGNNIDPEQDTAERGQDTADPVRNSGETTDPITVGGIVIDNPFTNEKQALFKNKIKPATSGNLIDPENVIGSESFYTKYNLSHFEKFKGYKIEMSPNTGDINVYIGDKVFTLIGEVFTDIVDNFSTIVNYSPVTSEYMNSTNRNNISEVLRFYNDEKLFDENSNLESPAENTKLLENVYINICKNLETALAKEFFFQEFFSNPSNHDNKIAFVNIKYINIQDIIREIREKINA